ncbi:hypothetical protein AB6G58_13995 [Providencia huaxiensis]
MDTWILVGVVLVCLLVLAPILAIIAISRTSSMQYQISELNQKVFSLETRLGQYQQSNVTPSKNVASSSDDQQGILGVTDELEQAVTNVPIQSSPVSEPEPSFKPLSGDTAYQQSEKAADSTNQTIPVPAYTQSAIVGSQARSGVNPNRFNKATKPNRFNDQEVDTSTQGQFNQKTMGNNESIFGHFFSWLLKGNPVAKIGILLLFLGVAYLLNYSVQNEIISPKYA